MQHAQRLMQETDWSLSRIAVESGFYDISAFTRRFRRETGMAPGRYRKSRM
jgi:AraC-like DNA-binding protein